MKQLAIIGAGPKAMAIAAKVTALSELGIQTPIVHIIEKQTIGANWNGCFGFTDGKQLLGTPPEKDVGFPYNSLNWGELNHEVNERMQRFTWQHFLVSTHQFSEWVDRGRPAPQHKLWAQYLRWVFSQVSDRVQLHIATLQTIRHYTDQWELGISGERSSQLKVDGLVLTGPAQFRWPHAIPNDDRVFTIQSFWKNSARLKSLESGKVAIVGTGENAATIASALSQNSDLSIDIISPNGMTYTRGENYAENRVYTNPDQMHWSSLSDEDKRQFISRTDRGVFSLSAQQALNQVGNYEIIAGRVVEVQAKDRIDVLVQYGETQTHHEYDYVVIATGSDQLGLLRGLLDQSTKTVIESHIGPFEEKLIEASIGEDLSISGLTPKIHLPMLSAMAQGPGFSNLSCLGHLSDRILQPYVEVPCKTQR